MACTSLLPSVLRINKNIENSVFETVFQNFQKLEIDRNVKYVYRAHASYTLVTSSHALFIGSSQTVLKIKYMVIKLLLHQSRRSPFFFLFSFSFFPSFKISCNKTPQATNYKDIVPSSMHCRYSKNPKNCYKLFRQYSRYQCC